MFWYSGKYNHSFVDSTQSLAAQMVYNSHFDLLAEITINPTGHNIIFYSGKNPVGCQILNQNWSEKSLVKPDIKFDLDKDLYFNAEKKWEIFATEYDQKEVYDSAVQKNSLFYEVKEDRWIIVNWFLNQNKIYFLTLHSNPKENLNLWTKSEYEVLSVRIPTSNQLSNLAGITN